MSPSGIAILVGSLLLPATATAQVTPSWTVAAGLGLVGPTADTGLVIAHFRFGPEWTQARGLGAGIDGGWACVAQMPVLGVATVSPSLIYSFSGRGNGVSLRGGYTFLGGFQAGVPHAAIAFDREIGPRSLLRIEVRDHVVGGFYAVEVTVGWVSN